MALIRMFFIGEHILQVLVKRTRIAPNAITWEDKGSATRCHVWWFGGIKVPLVFELITDWHFIHILFFRELVSFVFLPCWGGGLSIPVQGKVASTLFLRCQWHHVILHSVIFVASCHVSVIIGGSSKYGLAWCVARYCGMPMKKYNACGRCIIDFQNVVEKRFSIPSIVW